jgi:hypothetical protein
MVVTSTLKIFRTKNLLMLSTPSLMFDQRPAKFT